MWVGRFLRSSLQKLARLIEIFQKLSWFCSLTLVKTLQEGPAFQRVSLENHKTNKQSPFNNSLHGVFLMQRVFQFMYADLT